MSALRYRIQKGSYICMSVLLTNYNSQTSISDHMYRMAVLALCSSDVKLNIAKCVMLCIVHDLAEAQGKTVIRLH